MNGRCAVCKHRERSRIEMLLVGGASIRSVAKRFGINYYATRRHWLKHVHAEHKAALIAGPVKLSELVERAAEEGESLLDHLVGLRNVIYRRIDLADQAGDGNTVGLLAGRAIEVLREVGKLTGELHKASVSVTNNLFIMPLFCDLQAALVRVLGPYPGARSAVIAEFRRLESQASARMIEARPENEHDATHAA